MAAFSASLIMGHPPARNLEPPRPAPPCPRWQPQRAPAYTRPYPRGNVHPIRLRNIEFANLGRPKRYWFVYRGRIGAMNFTFLGRGSGEGASLLSSRAIVNVGAAWLVVSCVGCSRSEHRNAIDLFETQAQAAT